MIELTGKYNTAKIFTDNVEETALSQILNLLNQEFIIGSTIRIMPDVHAGAGCTIGTTMTLTDKVVPNLVGVDIGCGITASLLSKPVKDFEKIDNVIHNLIPHGFSIHDTQIKDVEKLINLNDLKCCKFLKANAIDRGYKSIGSLGGGNHFIEISKDAQNRNWLLIHSGSRNLGLSVATYYQNLTKFNTIKKSESMNYLQDTKSTTYFSDYLYDMNIIQKFAHLNRNSIRRIIIENMGWVVTEAIETVHNYIDTKNMILRKGAVSAQNGESLIIPINMKDGSLLCIGKGNKDWNYSAPHGAGRILSRKDAKESLNCEDYKKIMEGIYSTTVNLNTIDECPQAYKSIDDIVKNIDDTVDIKEKLIPVYNFKS